MELNPTAGVVNRHAGEIGGDGTVSGNAVEQSALAAVWLSDKSDPQSTSSTRILLARLLPRATCVPQCSMRTGPP